MTDTTVSAMVLLIKRSIAFADWAAGEGIFPAAYGDPEAESRNPDEFLLAYSQATGDEDWSTLADRITAAFEANREETAQLRICLGKLDGDSLDAMMGVIGEGPEFKRYNQGKSAMRDWFLRRISAISGGAA